MDHQYPLNDSDGKTSVEDREEEILNGAEDGEPSVPADPQDGEETGIGEETAESAGNVAGETAESAGDVAGETAESAENAGEKTDGEPDGETDGGPEAAEEGAGDSPEEEETAPAAECPAERSKELLAAGDVPAEEMRNAEELLHPVKKTTKRLTVAVTLLLILSLLLTAAVALLAVLALNTNKRLEKLKNEVERLPTQSVSSSGGENVLPIVLPDETSANAAVINVATACSPSVVTVKITTSSGTGSGSGVVYSSDGYIITNYHVVEDAVSVRVIFVDGSSFNATVIGADPENDLALLRINASGLTPVVFGDSDRMMVGELAVAIGNPLGTLANTVTDGIVSALARDISIEGTVYHVMQISCAINPGNSGGGCFNAKGELIGIVNAKKYQSGIEGLAFAIPVNTVKTSIAKLAGEDRTVLQKSIGVTSCYEVTEENYSEFNKSYLARIEKANDDKPLYGIYIYGDGNVRYVDEKNTLVNGDILIAVDGKSVSRISDINEILKDKEDGDEVTLKVCRLVTSGFWSSTYSLEEKEVKVRVVYMYR